MATYTIKLPQFQGPFDLLLFFIERDELDIHNIPISTITDDFLRYIRQMEAMNVDLASEFILVAATLMRIKAKILIPRKAIDEEGNEIDPREELVQRLLEYKRYKSVLDELRRMEEIRTHQFERGNVLDELQSSTTSALADAEMESLTLFKLLKVYERVMDTYEEKQLKTNFTIVRYNYTIKQQQRHIFSAFESHEKVDFDALFGICENRIQAIVTFLALLELLNEQKLHITQGNDINNFWLELVI